MHGQHVTGARGQVGTLRCRLLGLAPAPEAQRHERADEQTDGAPTASAAVASTRARVGRGGPGPCTAIRHPFEARGRQLFTSRATPVHHLAAGPGPKRA